MCRKVAIIMPLFIYLFIYLLNNIFIYIVQVCGLHQDGAVPQGPPGRRQSQGPQPRVAKGNKTMIEIKNAVEVTYFDECKG
jgi:hypothetical protein